MTSGRCSFAAATAATPSPTEATISTSVLIPSRSSSASRKTSLSSTSTIRTGGIRSTLFRAEQERVVRLPAFVHLDLKLRVPRSDSFDEAVEWRWLRAGQQRQERARIRKEARNELAGDVGKIVAAHDRLAVREAEPVATPDRQAVELDLTGGSRDLAGCDGCRGGGHLRGVLVGTAHAVVGDERGEPGRDGLGRHKPGGPFCLLDGVLRGEPHVRVVRQDDRLVCLQLLDRGQELGGRRVRRLTTGDDADRPDRLGERLEETPVPLPRHHRDDPAPRTRGRDERETPLALLLLLVHVGDLDSLDRARRGAERERRAGV